VSCEFLLFINSLTCPSKRSPPIKNVYLSIEKLATQDEPLFHAWVYLLTLDGSRWKVLAPFCALWARYGFYLYGHACVWPFLPVCHVYHFRNAFSTRAHTFAPLQGYCFEGDVNLNVLRPHRMLFCLHGSVFCFLFSVCVSN